MDARAEELIRKLKLEPHPEGGFYREAFRSPHEVQPSDARSERSALTSIYFLMTASRHSRWHRVASDEAWHFHEGDPLEVFWVDAEARLHRGLLGRAGDGEAEPIAVVPAGCWQSARTTGSYTLVGCTVGPGFDFEDFELIDATSRDWKDLQQVPNLPKGLEK